MPKGVNRWTGCGKKNAFFKNDPGTHGTPKQVFLAQFELVVAHFGLSESQIALKMGCFETKNGSKMPQKCVLADTFIQKFGVRKQVK